MKKKISCIIQARVNSKRLPGKILMQVFKKSLLQHQIERLKKLKTIDELVVATSKNKEDDQTSKIAKLSKVKIFRGDEKNVLKRYFDCAKINKSSIIIRVTADCPLIDIKYINELLKIFLKNDYDYLSNLGLNYLPDGFHCEIFNFKSLEKAQTLATSKFDREHVTSFLWSNPKIFSVHNYCGKKLKNHSKDIRLTLDYHEDYILIKKVFEKLYKKNKFFSLVKIIAFLENNKSLLKINEKYHKLQWNKFHSKRNL
jgi:spore coat polysaccharide biosynthesis protein SpsF|tara:strand:+ start:988 stop:1755 length:768 start_codon:yes stop_codon:yes gene_type:complete